MSIGKGTIARTIVLFIALLNQVLAIYGKEPISIADDDVYQLCTLLFTIGSTLVVWWKNNSFTKHAIAADEKMKEWKTTDKEPSYSNEQEFTDDAIYPMNKSNQTEGND